MPDNIYTLKCELCKGGHHEEQIILCDHCDKGCHMFCLSPPLDAVPEGDWLCPSCVAKHAHGFIEGHEYSLLEFEKAATSFKNDFLGGALAAKKVRNLHYCKVGKKAPTAQATLRQSCTTLC